MRTDRLQRLLNLSQGNLTPADARHLASETYAVMAWVISMCGPIALADKASWELVSSECWLERMDGHDWYRAHPDQLPLDQDEIVHRELMAALRYLNDRGLLMSHHGNPNLVRPVPALEALCS
ncbi:hypothetical protein KW843_07630 [Acidovorax sp. sif1233]|uniref:hypothetical protein n=1 Tax=Acidovorax sp. sif1233 TaxID=2854792 RepID=UPI001C436B8C|nr:hypothetical protein [Acidovorax sp. sif1233]MBV7454337.1 hypothetical protein [Acidovorax sp. sif1233]